MNERSVVLVTVASSGIAKADQLRSENQFLNPFKYTVYLEIIGKEERRLPNRR